VYWYKVGWTSRLDMLKIKVYKNVWIRLRHLAIDGDERKLLYLTGELDLSIRVLSYDSGKLDLLSAYKVYHRTRQITHHSKILYEYSLGGKPW